MIDYTLIEPVEIQNDHGDSVKITKVKVDPILNTGTLEIMEEEGLVDESGDVSTHTIKGCRIIAQEGMGWTKENTRKLCLADLLEIGLLIKKDRSLQHVIEKDKDLKNKNKKKKSQ